MTKQNEASILVLGCGDAFDPEHGNSSFLYSADSTKILIDCGYDAVSRVMELPSAGDIDAVAITHFHADHVFGLPVLLAYYSLRLGRTKPLTIIAPPGSESRLRALACEAHRSTLEKAKFELTFADISREQTVGNISIRSAPMEHGIETWAIVLKSTHGQVAFSSDGKPTEAALAMFSQCRFLFQECYSERPTGPVHSSLEEIVELRPRLRQLEKIFLVHIRADERDSVSRRLVERGPAEGGFEIPRRGQLIRLPEQDAFRS